MFSWILQITILSIILIWLVHHIFHFLKDTLTVPKMKDLVNEPDKKYKNMYEIINNQNSKDFRENLLPTVDTSNTQMKNELKNYLKKQMQT